MMQPQSSAFLPIAGLGLVLPVPLPGGPNWAETDPIVTNFANFMLRTLLFMTLMSLVNNNTLLFDHRDKDLHCILCRGIGKF